MQRNLIKSLLQLHVSETIEFYDLSQVVVLRSCIYVKVSFVVVFVVVVDDWAQTSIQLEVSPIIQLEICERVHYPTLYAHGVHLDRVLTKLRSHY